MLRNIKEIDLINISYGNCKTVNNTIHVPIKYNSERFIIKTNTVTCIQYDNEHLMIENEELIQFVDQIEKKIVKDTSKYGKKWGAKTGSKYISIINNYDYKTVININIFDIKPMLYNKDKNIINTDMTGFQGSIKSLIEVKNIVINNNTNSNTNIIFVYFVIHQIQFIKSEEIFTQITDFALSDDDNNS